VGFFWLTATAVRLARFNIQGKEGDKRYFIGLPSPAAAGVPAATVFAYTQGLAEVGVALAALGVVLVPAALMVSRVRFRSFGTLIPGRRRSYLTPLVIAGVISAIAVQPQVVLLVMAYSYLASGPIGIIVGRARRRPVATDADDESRPSARTAR
jgi:CDP-diacylglycerol--serine O-phosphatidyltransferase